MFSSSTLKLSSSFTSSVLSGFISLDSHSKISSLSFFPLVVVFCSGVWKLSEKIKILLLFNPILILIILLLFWK